MMGIAPGTVDGGAWHGYKNHNNPTAGYLTPRNMDWALDAHISQSIIAKDTAFMWRSPTYTSLIQHYNPGKDAEVDGDPDLWMLRGIQPKLDIVASAKEREIRVPIQGEHKASESIVEVPINKAGIYFSKAENAKQAFLDFVYDGAGNVRPEQSEYISFLASKGLTSPMEVKYIGCINKKHVYARVGIAQNGSVSLSTGQNFGKNTADLAEMLRISDVEGIRKVMHSHFQHEVHHLYEEHNHHYEALIEMELAEELAEFYMKMAERSTGDAKRLYSKLAHLCEHDVQHWQSKVWSMKSTKSHSKAESRLESLVKEAEELGLSREEARGYISEVLEREVRDDDSSEANNPEATENNSEIVEENMTDDSSE